MFKTMNGSVKLIQKIKQGKCKLVSVLAFRFSNCLIEHFNPFFVVFILKRVGSPILSARTFE